MHESQPASRDSTVIDVVIPTIGRDSLQRAISSARQPEVGQIIVVLDDPSKFTEIEAIANGHGAELLVTPGHSGGGFARQMGLAKVTAPLVAFLDDDDEWLPHRGAHVTAAFSSVTPGRDAVVLSRFIFVRADGTPSLVPATLPDPRHPSALASYMVRRDRLRFGRHAVQTSALALSASLARRIGWAHDLPKHQDWDLIARASVDRNTELVIIPQPTVSVAQGSSSSVSKTQNWQASMRWFRRHRDKLTYRSASDFLAVHVLRAALRQRSGRGIRAYFRQRRYFPHVAAGILAASGLVGRS